MIDLSKEIIIPKEILAYANATYEYYVPKRRYSGFNENGDQRRGGGDLIALVAALMIYDLFCQNDRVSNLELTSGDGDNKDLAIRINGKYKPINIKASAYAPYRENLNLFVKEEELKKESFFAYIQCFVHLDEPGYEPHIHIPGGCSVKSKIWKEHSDNFVIIPNTEGHKGIKIPCDKLTSLQKLIDYSDKKF